jgi:hypothetical protein
MPECCANPSNREWLLRVERCRECGRIHRRITLDPGRLEAPLLTPEKKPDDEREPTM